MAPACVPSRPRQPQSGAPHPPGSLPITHTYCLPIIHTCYPSFIVTTHTCYLSIISYLLPIIHSYHPYLLPVYHFILATRHSYLLPIIHTHHPYLLPTHHSLPIIHTHHSYLLPTYHSHLLPIIHTYHPYLSFIPSYSLGHPRQEPADTTRKHTPRQPEHHQKNSDVRRVGLDAGPVARWRPHASPAASASPSRKLHTRQAHCLSFIVTTHTCYLPIIHTCYLSSILTIHTYTYHSYSLGHPRQEPADTTRKHTPRQPEHHQKNSDVRRVVGCRTSGKVAPACVPSRLRQPQSGAPHPPGSLPIIHTYHSYLLPVYHSYLSLILATCLSFIPITHTCYLSIIHTYHSYLLPVYHSYLSLILATCLSFILTPIIPIIHTFIITKTPPPGASGHNQETHATPARAPPEEQRR